MDALVAVLIFDKMEERDRDRFRRHVRGALFPMGVQPMSGRWTSSPRAAEGGPAERAMSAGKGVSPVWQSEMLFF